MPRPRLTTSQRGYGYHHQRRRSAALRALVPGTPCPYCGHPMYSDMELDLDHADPLAYGGDPRGPRRLAHAPCNRRAGAIIGNRWRSPATITRGNSARPSRQW